MPTKSFAPRFKKRAPAKKRDLLAMTVIETERACSEMTGESASLTL